MSNGTPKDIAEYNEVNEGYSKEFLSTVKST